MSGSQCPPDRFRQLHLITTPSAWEFWPFLPLVRRCSQALELGVLFDARNTLELYGFSTCVFRTNLFTLPPTLEEFLNLPREMFDTPEELLQAGWQVD